MFVYSSWIDLFYMEDMPRLASIYQLHILVEILNFFVTRSIIYWFDLKTILFLSLVLGMAI